MTKKPIDILTPIVDIDGQKFLMSVPAGVAVTDLGPEVASLANQRNAVVAAIDFLATGI
jgi:hypothetical protein